MNLSPVDIVSNLNIIEMEHPAITFISWNPAFARRLLAEFTAWKARLHVR